MHSGKPFRDVNQGDGVEREPTKLTEETGDAIGRRLIEAHEQERTWLARELHDDVNQQIAVIAIKLDRLKQHLSNATIEVQNEIAELRQRVSQLGWNIQALSHRLHSSKLDYLGIVAAVQSFCDELSTQHQIQIDFNHSDMPRKLPTEISLCLFRVLQEALQNAVKHSGVRRFKVEMHARQDEAELTIADDGAGFDPETAMTGSGLGLISMRERLQLVNGHLSIRSEKGRGTTVSARVPFQLKT